MDINVDIDMAIDRDRNMHMHMHMDTYTDPVMDVDILERQFFISDVGLL
jgi:hypothetical protein